MTTTPTDNKLGFTLVWEGKPTEFVNVIRQWSSVPSDLLVVESAPNPSNILLFVANEWIDWQHLRVTEEFRPVNFQALRSSDSLFNHQVMEFAKHLDANEYRQG